MFQMIDTSIGVTGTTPGSMPGTVLPNSGLLPGTTLTSPSTTVLGGTSMTSRMVSNSTRRGNASKLLSAQTLGTTMLVLGLAAIANL